MVWRINGDEAFVILMEVPLAMLVVLVIVAFIVEKCVLAVKVLPRWEKNLFHTKMPSQPALEPLFRVEIHNMWPRKHDGCFLRLYINQYSSKWYCCFLCVWLFLRKMGVDQCYLRFMVSLMNNLGTIKVFTHLWWLTGWLSYGLADIQLHMLVQYPIASRNSSVHLNCVMCKSV